MTTSSNGNIFRVNRLVCVEFTGHRWVPPTKGSYAELWCFLWSALEETAEQTNGTLAIWDAIAWWRHGNVPWNMHSALACFVWTFYRCIYRWSSNEWQWPTLIANWRCVCPVSRAGTCNHSYFAVYCLKSGVSFVIHHISLIYSP